MTANSQNDVIRRIHAAPPLAVLAVTGGGSGAISALLAVPGASQTVLEAVVPYSSQALVDFLRCTPEQFCSSYAARQMAMAAFRRAETLRAADPGDVRPIVGIGCTASLASDRPKRGAHRVHLAAQSATTTWSWSVELAKGRRSRAEEEAVAAALVIGLLAEACGLTDLPEFPLFEGETIVRRRTDALPSWIELAAGTVRRTDARPGVAPRETAATAVLPGSFNPLHDGHRQMAAVAAAKLGVPVDFELSIENVEKPPLDFQEMHDRASQFDPNVRVWFTRAPRMKQKAALFPGAYIVCGMDTLLRVADVRFAGGSDSQRDADVAEIASHGCRFLVFGRATAAGFETLDDVTLPPALRAICIGVPEAEFRVDVSSTEVRQSRCDD